jgi:PAS domain S-box-containing protein
VGRDGIVRARYWERAQAAELGENLGGSELFTRLTNHDQGSYLDNGDQAAPRDISIRDGISRILSYRALKEYPLLVRVGVAESDALATFRSRRPWYFFGAGLFSVVTAAFAWLLIGSMTRKKGIEADLRTNEIRLRDAQAMGQMGSWELDLHSNRLVWSDEIYRILEADSRQFTASIEAFHKLVHPMDQAQVRNAYAGSVMNGVGYDLEYRLLMPNGNVKFVHERCSTDFDGSGKPLRSRGTVQNITVRREIAAESARLAAIVESSQDAILSCSLDATILTWNTGAERLFGYSAAEAKGRDASIIVPVGERDAYYERWLPAAQQGRFPPPYETVRITKEGRRIDVSASLSPIYDDAQQINAISIVIRDLSQQRALQSALRATEIKLRLVAANVPGMVFELQRCEGEHGAHFTYASEGSKKLFGLNPDQLCGRPDLLTGRIAAADREAFLSSLEVSAQNLSPWAWQGRAVSQHDTLGWVQLEAKPHLGESGMIIWDGIAIDISDVKNSELKLRQTQQQLRALTAHHEEIREEERARIARELHDELGQLLTGVKLHLSTHRTGGTDRRANQKYVVQLVEQAIMVTRHAVADLRPPVLDQGFTAAVRWYAEQFFRRTGIVCEAALEDDASILDQHHRVPLFRVLQESLTNVAKHAGATRVEIQFTANGKHCRLQVRDNGKGFGQDSVASKRTFGLLGMRERVTILGGCVNVESAPGKGTAVIVDIPKNRCVA